MGNDHYLVFKALHIITVVTWFAGLFYMPRLFVYFAEADTKPETEKNVLQKQFKIMQRRLWYGITIPSTILAPTFAGFMLPLWDIKHTPWLRIKLWLVVLLFVYEAYLHIIFLRQQKNIVKESPLKLRFINEISTLFLVSIVFLVVMKDAIGFIYALAGLLLLIVVLISAINIYKRVRENKTVV